jgi:hypothetical protein
MGDCLGFEHQRVVEIVSLYHKSQARLPPSTTSFMNMNGSRMRGLKYDITACHLHDGRATLPQPMDSSEEYCRVACMKAAI